MFFHSNLNLTPQGDLFLYDVQKLFVYMLLLRMSAFYLSHLFFFFNSMEYFVITAKSKPVTTRKQDL